MMLASGVFERFPKLSFVTVEADIGWIPWLLDALDTIYYKRSHVGAPVRRRAAKHPTGTPIATPRSSRIVPDAFWLVNST